MTRWPQEPTPEPCCFACALSTTAFRGHVARIGEISVEVASWNRDPEPSDFEIVASREMPNEETRRAMVLAEAKALGIVADNDPAFTDADALMSSLDAG